MKIVVGMSGSSGSVYGIRLLETLNQLPDVETELVMSPAAELNIREETAWDPEKVKKLATRTHDWRDVGATISSGSYKTDGMIVAPCSANSLASIAYGVNANNLLLRAADVTLKERRRLVILFRETPLHRAAAFGDEEAIQMLLDAGAVIDAKDMNGETPLSWASWHLRPAPILRKLCYGDIRIHPQYTGMEANLLGKPNV